jgi:hypothetical protein
MKLVEDLGAPGLVTATDLLTLEFQPTWNEWAAYILTGVGYLGGWFMNRGLGPLSTDFFTKVGVASLPLTARHIYNRVKTTGTTTRSAQRFALRPQTSARSSSVSRMYQSEFEEAGSHAF